jgi:phospholipase/carboxylesterase
MNKLETIIREPNQTATSSVIWLHGLGADGNDFIDIVPELQLPKEFNVRFIFPHAPVRPIAINANMQMRAWYNIYSLGDLNQEDEPGIQASQTLVTELIEAEVNHGINTQNIFLAGFSQGGATALYTGLRYPKHLGGIIALSCYLPLSHKLTEQLNPANSNIPIFMAHGTLDPVLPCQLGEQTFQQLKQMNYPIEWLEYPMQHQVCLPEIVEIGKWLAQKLRQYIPIANEF